MRPREGSVIRRALKAIGEELRRFQGMLESTFPAPGIDAASPPELPSRAVTAQINDLEMLTATPMQH